MLCNFEESAANITKSLQAIPNKHSILLIFKTIICNQTKCQTILEEYNSHSRVTTYKNCQRKMHTTFVQLVYLFVRHICCVEAKKKQEKRLFLPQVRKRYCKIIDQHSFEHNYYGYALCVFSLINFVLQYAVAPVLGGSKQPLKISECYTHGFAQWGHWSKVQFY